MSVTQVRRVGAVSLVALMAAGSAMAQDRGVSYTLYGTPGLLEMPSAISANDGEIAGTFSLMGGINRNSFTFQITPRLSGTFRYSGIAEYYGEGEDTYYDRSFDVRYRFTDEGEWMPMIAVGLQDFLGTGIFSSEYLVATKTLSDSFRVTAGLGWGRLGTFNEFDNPFGLNDRPSFDGSTDEGGRLSFDSYFRGPAALFGGLEWAVTDRMAIKAEYSSDDAYVNRYGEPLFERASPLNFGVSYTPTPGYQFGLAYLYGSELAFTATISVNPDRRTFPGGLDAAPQPVQVRQGDARAALTWDRTAMPAAGIHDNVQTLLRREGIDVDAIEITDRTARIRYTNTRYRSEAQAMGRIVRVLTAEMPPSVETFILEPMQRGIPLASATFSRTDVEELENEVGGTAEMYNRFVLSEAGSYTGLTPLPSVRDQFSWGISPYATLLLFSGDQPFQFSAGIDLSAAYRFEPNLIMAGSIRQRLYYNTKDAEVVTDENWPVVRRNAAVYTEQGNPGIDYLTLAYYGRPAPQLYSRLTVGYLERMFGGVSSELLYQPVDAAWAVGVEANYVMQRDFDMLFGFQDYEVATGHASFYYSFDNGFMTKVDMGRYLAGDWGATFSLDREFDNGWLVGAYFTLTTMPFDEFGEGSFDKGIRLTIPTDFVFGQPNRREVTSTLQSLNRDGGAQLEVQGRLYDVVRDAHRTELNDSWGRFWR